MKLAINYKKDRLLVVVEQERPAASIDPSTGLGKMFRLILCIYNIRNVLPSLGICLLY